MDLIKDFPNSLQSIKDFDSAAKEVFLYQKSKNKLYGDYLANFKSNEYNLESIPFLPISFFKNFEVKTGDWQTSKVFKSSGTTGSVQSSHHIYSLDEYHLIANVNFSYFFGDVSKFTYLALLPSYLERKDSSLVEMVQSFMKQSNSKFNGFYLDSMNDLKNKIMELDSRDTKILLIGVSFALLDLPEFHGLSGKNLTVMETGGMKGRRKEIVREDLHREISSKFDIETIASEYGMTELLSQAYAHEKGRFRCPPWMKVIIREINDPFSCCKVGETGVINVVDLANMRTCAFIETQDLGRLHEDGSFEVLGRLDNSDIRGCNLMVD